LTSQDKEIMPNAKGFYPGLEMCGKNFTVKWMENRGKAKRHYTVCNVMRLDVYKTICEILCPERFYDRKAANAPRTEEDTPFNETADINQSENSSRLTKEEKIAKLDKLLETGDRNQIELVVKNYRNPPGVSVRFFVHSDDARFMVKGPMGKGLNASGEGLHIVFAGGVGMLPFADLVA